MAIVTYILVAIPSFLLGAVAILYLLYGRGWNDAAGARAAAKKKDRELSRITA